MAYAHYRIMDSAINSKKQALKGLKKIVDDMQ
jgi:hypothetical protein